MSKITVYEGKWDATCTVGSNLTANQAKSPVIRDVIQYVEPRMLSTLIVSGAKSPWDLKNTKSKIGKIPQGKLIGDNAYRYNVLGRIQKKSVINSQVGTSKADGTFSLSVRDNYIVPGMVCVFYSSAIQARVQGQPTGSAGNYVYNFQTVDGTVFDYNVHVAPQSGEPTVFGAFTSYSEKSLRGYGRTHYPDQQINHLTIQRKTIGITGSALTDVLWVHYNGTKGWFYEKERQGKIQFLMENEFHKWFSKSTMKDAGGNLLNRSNLIDPETGEEVVIGDGVISQIEGGNELFGSGADGLATIEDMSDMMSILERKSDAVYNKVWYVVTGTKGYANAQDILRDYWTGSLGGQNTVAGGAAGTVGGQDISVGANFDIFNLHGNKLIFVKHPFFDDEEKFFDLDGAGFPKQSSMYVFLDMGTYQGGKANMEILGKGAYGINRTMVSAYLNGLTGYNGGTVVSTVDAKEYNMLKEDGLFIYNTTSCGIVRNGAI